MPRIPMRLRALGLTSLIAVVVMTAAPIESVAATPPNLANETATATSAATGGSATALGTTSTSLSSAALAGRTGEPLTVDASTPTSTAAAAPPAVVPAAAVVVAFARSHLRARYRHASTGPSAFDCSGLMWRVFREAGLGRKVTSRSARAIYVAYLRRGLASRGNARVGDLVVWGHGSHVGVYIGNGYAISALVSGVRIHRVRAMLTPFTAYLHTRLSGLVKPAWELQVAKHERSTRHTTRSVFLRTTPSSSSLAVGSLRTGTRFVVLARRRDAGGRLWLQVLTYHGRIGWLPLAFTAR